MQPVVAVQPEVGPVVSTERQRSLERFQKFHSPRFSVGASEDVQGLLDQCYQIMGTVGFMVLSRV